MTSQPLDYDRLAADYARHRRVHPGVLRDLIETGHIAAASRVLEVGCGTGNYISALQAATGCPAWGLDPSEQMLAQAQQHGGATTFRQGRAETLPFADGAFDLVFSVDVIHHVADRAAYFGEAQRVLAPGGQVCTATDSEWIIRNRVPLSRYFPDTVEPELARYPRIEVIRAWMAQVGFVDLAEVNVESAYALTSLTDLGPYRAKAYSALHLISEDAFQRSIAQMERDVQLGPIPCVSRYVMVWGRTKNSRNLWDSGSLRNGAVQFARSYRRLSSAAFNNPCNTCGLPLPLVSFIVWPTRN